MHPSQNLKISVGKGFQPLQFSHWSLAIPDLHKKFLCIWLLLYLHLIYLISYKAETQGIYISQLPRVFNAFSLKESQSPTVLPMSLPWKEMAWSKIHGTPKPLHTKLLSYNELNWNVLTAINRLLHSGWFGVVGVQLTWGHSITIPSPKWSGTLL